MLCTCIFRLFNFYLGYLDHLQGSSVLKQAVLLQDEAILVPVLTSVDSNVNGLAELLNLELIGTFLEIWDLDDAVVPCLPSRDDLYLVKQVLKYD